MLIFQQPGFLEYIFAIGIVISFVALIIGAFKDRRNIKEVLKEHGFRLRDLAIIIAILLVFILIEAYFVKATQLLFFDDDIYQAMALMLLHMGQAWMCNFGNATACFSGQIFHEPIGLSFNFAIAYLLFGVSRGVGYGTEFGLGILSVFMSFFAALLLMRNKKAAFFTELIMALTPVIIVWSKPTNSDLAVLAYSMIAIFFFLIFMRKRNMWSFSNMLFSFSLLLYMKVDEFFFIPIFIAFYLLLESKGVVKTAKNTIDAIRKNILNTKLLLVVLFFMIAVVPSILYSYYESQTDGYGWQGTTIQNTCHNLVPISVSSEINIINFKANVCANVLYWFDQYAADYVMQPIIFTFLAILGAVLMLATGKNRRTFVAIAIWFGLFFLLYAAFYAGSVIYGVDWRFMLSLAAQAAMLGGFACAEMFDMADYYAKRFIKSAMTVKAINCIVLVAILVLLFTPIYLLMPKLAVNPSSIPQAGDARFDENLVYNSSSSIPNNCLVYSYDPTLFQLVGKNSTQIGDLYNVTQVDQYMQQRKCLVLDYGYWCYTPNNECTYASQNYNIVPITTATYRAMGRTYGFYYVYQK